MVSYGIHHHQVWGDFSDRKLTRLSPEQAALTGTNLSLPERKAPKPLMRLVIASFVWPAELSIDSEILGGALTSLLFED
jgi:hypothetical protein